MAKRQCVHGLTCLILAGALISGTAVAQGQPGNSSAASDPAPPASGRAAAVARAGEIASQPARDLGASKVTIPPVLQAAIESPYSLEATKNCRQLAGAVQNLNAVLGPDFVAGATTNENRASKIAEAGGKTIVNSLLPFRGLVREMTGAAPAERRLNAAIDAGYARRGFLRGMQRGKGCRV